MKVKFLFSIILIVLVGAIQTSIPKMFEFGYAGIKPNLLLIFIIFYAFFNGSYKGGVIGFTAGLVQDFSTGTIIGFYALIGLIMGLIIGWTNNRIYKENIFVAVILIFLGTIFYELSVSILLGIKLFTGDNLLYAFKFIIFPEAIYNSFISIIVYFVMNYINKRFNKAPIRDLYI